eukprot:CAMPEP_0179044594 /NCGR_PEP_ID=MMETSP0796-20121207/17751_1 /TAXON_ID=73915 /ORGANISM="Pyrodinium bahamense, Strain pbaha01" /LENGTH=98 /DNA_ID=CAMNT_0020740991 /DNA_START=143 /DNA_END=439 /DNA_ORIENTATION=-
MGLSPGFPVAAQALVPEQAVVEHARRVATAKEAGVAELLALAAPAFMVAVLGVPAIDCALAATEIRVFTARELQQAVGASPCLPTTDQPLVPEKAVEG